MSFLILDSAGYELESKKLFSNMTSIPDSARKRTINSLIKRLKNDGTWNLIDVLWVMASHDQQAARLNWKSPGNFTLTEVNTPTWTANQGYTGDGASTYLNTSWDASNNGVNYTQNSASKGAYIRTNSQEAGFALGALGAANGSHIVPRNASNQLLFRENQASSTTIASVTASTGLISTTRTSSTAIEAFRNGTSLGTASVASTAVESIDFYIMAFNNNGSASGYTSRQQSVAYIGSGSINQTLLFNAIEEYMDAIGSGVI